MSLRGERGEASEQRQTRLAVGNAGDLVAGAFSRERSEASEHASSRERGEASEPGTTGPWPCGREFGERGTS